MNRFLSASALGAAAVLALAGCSSNSDTAGSTSPGEKIKIGLAYPAGNETYWTAYINAAQEEANKLGVDITFTDAKSDANTQNEQVNSLVAAGAKGISISSVEPTANKLAALAATDAGIPLITSNRTLDVDYGGESGANPRVHVGFNDHEIGQKQGELVIKACENIDPCQVVLEEGTAGSTTQVQRTGGLEEAIKGSPNIKILDKQNNDFDPTKAVDVTQSLLQKHAKFDVLLTHEDPTAVAAARVIEGAGRAAGIKVIGIGGSKDGINAVKSGNLFGTVWLSPGQDGGFAVASLVSIIKGEAIKDLKTSGERPTVEVPTVSVTKENADKYPGEW